MNDISVKIVESPKGAVAVASPAPEIGVGEVDPLAIDDEVKGKQEEPATEKSEDCDENAKEDTPTVEQKEEDQNVSAPSGEAKITEGLDKVIEELKKVSQEEIEETVSTNKPEEPLEHESKTPAVTTNAETVEQKEPTPEPEAAPSYNYDPPTPDLNTPPPEEENEEIQETVPEPVEEIKEEPPLAPTPEAVVPEVLVTPEVVEPEIPKQKPVESTDVEMMEVPVQLPIPVQFATPIQLAAPVQEMPVRVEAQIPSVPIKSQALEKETKIEKETVVEEKAESKLIKVVKESDLKPLNGDIAKEEQATKRRASEEVETDSPLKKLCQEVEKTFPQHDTMINDYIQTATKNNIDEIQRHTEQLLAEIQTLRELAQKKEHEWNNILHLKKVKEEILLRLLRRKQVLSFEKSAEINGAERPGIDPFDFLNQAKNLAIDKSDDISGLSIKQPGSTMNPMMQAPVMPVTTHFNPMSGLPPPYDKVAQMHLQNMPKPVFHQPLMMPGTLPGFPRDMNGQLSSNFNMPMGRQGPTKDVKSIIADYRQRNPDITPRRGRRMKSILNPNMMNAPRSIAPKVDNMNNLNNINSLNNLNMLFNNLDVNQKAMLERLQQIQAGGLQNSMFKDALVQFANMQQASSGLLPNRPPETITHRPEHHMKERRRERNHEQQQQQQQQKQQPPERMPSTSPRLPPPPPYPEISLLPVTNSQEAQCQQNSLLHGILTKPAPPQSFSPTLAKLLTSPERKSSSAPAVLPSFGQAKNCGEITITPVQPTPPPAEPQQEKTEEVVQLDDEESPASEGEASGSPAGSGSGRLVIDEASAEAAETPLCQGCRRRDAQFVCAGCANQWYCSRDCQVAAWDEHSEMCSG